MAYQDKTDNVAIRKNQEKNEKNKDSKCKKKNFIYKGKIVMVENEAHKIVNLKEEKSKDGYINYKYDLEKVNNVSFKDKLDILAEMLKRYDTEAEINNKKISYLEEEVSSLYEQIQNEKRFSYEVMISIKELIENKDLSDEEFRNKVKASFKKLENQKITDDKK